MERWKQLIQIAQDESARDDERDDAIIDLAEFNSDQIKYKLYEIATNDKTIDMLRASCGATLAEIWIRDSSINYELLLKLNGVALAEALSQIKAQKNHWFKEYERLKGI